MARPASTGDMLDRLLREWNRQGFIEFTGGG
jgi:hypothetical protein